MISELNRTQHELVAEHAMIHNRNDGASADVISNFPVDLRSGESDKSPDEGKPSVLCLRPQWNPLIEDMRKFVATPANIPCLTKHEHKPFWKQQLLSIGRAGAGDVREGSFLWDKLALDVPHRLTEGVLNVKNIDDDTARAAHSALIGTYNSSLNENDLEAAAHALSVFLNTHPMFSHMSDAEEFEAPFGKETVYELVNLRTPQD